MQSYGQKKVPAESIKPGDMVFRSTKAGGDLVMDVQSVTPSRIGDRDVIVCRGMTYALSGSGFLDSISGDPLGDDSWSIPVSGRVYKRVPIDEADFDY